MAQHVDLVAGGGGGEVALHRLAARGVGGVGVEHVDALGEAARSGKGLQSEPSYGLAMHGAVQV